MSQQSKIEWTDHAASPWHGCAHGVYVDAQGNEHEHPGCLNCYAEQGAKRNPGTLGIWGKEGTRVKSASFVKNCIRWNKEAETDGVIRSVFPSICDPFEEWNGFILNSQGQRLARDTVSGGYTTTDLYIGRDIVRMDDLRRELFETIDCCQNLRFLLLTKRPQNIRRMWPSADLFDKDSEHKAYWSNVCLLTSISNQETADSLTDFIVDCADLCPTVGISLEPMLGPVNLSRRFLDLGSRAWLICGGESGHGARPMHPDWVRSIRDQCVEAGVAFFFKQWGTWEPSTPSPVAHATALSADGDVVAISHHDTDGWYVMRKSKSAWQAEILLPADVVTLNAVGKQKAGRILDGRTWDEMPKREAVSA